MNRKEFMAMGIRSMAAAAVFPPVITEYLQDILQSDAVRRIHRHIEQNKEDHVRKIQSFLRQPSVSSWNTGIRETAEMVRSFFRELRCKEAELVPTEGYPGVWGFYDAGAPKTISHYDMYDTQPFNEKEWSSPPLEARRVRMGKFPEVIIARGAINSKGPLRAFQNTLQSILAVEGKLPVNIMFVAEGEEEQGSPHFHQILERYQNRLKTCASHLNPGPSQNVDGEVTLSLGNKGIMYVELEAAGAEWGRGPQKMPIHSSRKAVLDSPVWRLVQALASMVEGNGNKILIEGWYDDIQKPTAEQEQLVRSLQQKFRERLFASESENMKAFIDNWSAEEAIRHLFFDTTLNIDGLWAGYTGEGVATILPEKAAVKMDARLIPDQSADRQMEKLRRHLDSHGFTDIKIRKMGGGDEWSYTSPAKPVVQAVLNVYQRYGIEPMIFPWNPGSSPQAQYTRPPLDLPACGGGLGHGGRAHAIDEYFVMEGDGKVGGILECEKSMVDILYAYANWPE